MSNEKISGKTMKSIEDFAKYLSFKLGYTSDENMTYLEEIKRGLQMAKEDWKRDVDDMKKETAKVVARLGLSPTKKEDFAEEMKLFLADHVEDLISQGYSEEEALKKTMQQFSEEDFSEIKRNGWEGMEMRGKMETRYEAIGVFYAAFLFLGLGGGAWMGYAHDHLWLGLGIGGAIGLGLGLLSHGLVTLKAAK